jgi:hypothetical protein
LSTIPWKTSLSDYTGDGIASRLRASEKITATFSSGFYKNEERSTCKSVNLLLALLKKAAIPEM